MPANRLPSVCWAARPTTTAVNAPPSGQRARARARRCAARSARRRASSRAGAGTRPCPPSPGPCAGTASARARARRRGRTASRATISARTVTIRTASSYVGPKSVGRGSRRRRSTPTSTGTSTSDWIRARLTARRLSCRARPTSRQEWLCVVKNCRMGSGVVSSRGVSQQHRRRRRFPLPGVMPVTAAGMRLRTAPPAAPGGRAAPPDPVAPHAARSDRRHEQPDRCAWSARPDRRPSRGARPAGAPRASRRASASAARGPFACVVASSRRSRSCSSRGA